MKKDPKRTTGERRVTGASSAERHDSSSFSRDAAASSRETRLEAELRHATEELAATREQLARRTGELREAAATAEKAAVARGLFLSHMSHDMRTPITGIFGMVQLLQGTRLSRQQREFVGNLEDSARNLFALIENILDLSKMEAGSVVLQSEPFIVADTVHDLVKIHRERVSAKGLDLSVSLDESVPAIVYGDPVRFRQVLSTLLSGVIRLSHQGRVELSGALENRDAEGAVIHFRIRDTATGIQPEVLADMFNSFADMQESTARQFGGTALGLAVCSQLAELMGGRVWGGAVDGGSELHFTARFGLPEEETGKGERAVLNVLVENQKTELRVLVAEDDRISRRLIEQAVQKSGFVVTVVTNGREAVEALARERFDAVLMDVSMPELDGMSATQQLRSFPANNPNRSIPVIALTAHSYMEDRQRCLNAGMSDVLVKPFLFETLRDVLLHHIGRS